MNNTSKFVFFHLYNDFSGSPMVLTPVINGFIDKGMDVELVTSKGGILDTIKEHKNFKRHSFFYRFSRHCIITLKRFAVAQTYMFFFAFRYAFDKNVTFYINTILPVGPAIAGKLMGKRIVYHCHENAWMKGRVYKELSRIMTWIADEIICVSDYQRNTLHCKRHANVVYNSVSDKFRKKLIFDPDKAFDRKEVIMACSAKLYKGIKEFMAVAALLPQYHFTLILNIREDKKDCFLKRNNIKPTDNVNIVSRVENMAEYYNKSSIVMNLSNRNQFIETYGMTISEGLCAGLPCIVPVIGGVKELIDEGHNGFHIDSSNVEEIALKIDYILSDRDTYIRMAKVAIEGSTIFNEKKMIDKIIALSEGEK